MLVIAFGLALFMAFFEPGILVSLLYLHKNIIIF